MVDQKVLGQVVSEQMAAIEADTPDGKIEAALSIVGLDLPDGEQAVRMRSNQSPKVAMQLLAAAQQVVAAQIAQEAA